MALAAQQVSKAFLLRVAAPSLLERAAKLLLHHLPGYRGDIDKIDVQLLRGTLTVRGVRVDRLTEGGQEPVFRLEEATFRLHWKGLLSKSIIGDLRLDQPVLYVTVDPKDDSAQNHLE